VKIAAVKIIELFLENLGCTLDNYMIDILRALVQVFLPQNDEKAKGPTFEFAFGSLIHGVIEKFISVLSSISSHILHQIFYNLLVNYLND
jgi:hypothetical protein